MKKIIATILTLAIASFAFATGNGYKTLKQRVSPIHDIPSASSYTDATTSGVFGTDVDDFMDVNSYTNVQPEKFFGFLGYNYDDTYNTGVGFNFGFAKQFKPFYLGYWFGGTVDGFTMESVFDDTDKANKTDYEYNAEASRSYTGAVLLGFDKFAVKTSMLYNPKDGKGYYSKLEPDSGDSTIKSADTYEIYFDVQVGLATKLAPHFEIGLDSWVEKAYDNSNGTVDKSFYDLYLRGGITKDLKSNDDIFTHSWDFDLDTRWRIKPIVQNENDDGSDENIGEANNLIQLSATYNVELTATDKLTLGASIGLPLKFGMIWDPEYTKAIKGDKVYGNRNISTDILFVPTLDFGVQYAAVPNKFQLNAGTNIEIGTIGWNIDATQFRKSDSSSVDSTSTDVTFGYNSEDFSTSWTCGFTAFFGKNVTLDASYNILEDLTNNSIDYSSKNDIWETAQAIFVHKLEFLVTVKL